MDPQTYIGERTVWSASGIWNITDLGTSLPNQGGVVRTEFCALLTGTGSGGNQVLSDEEIRQVAQLLWPSLVIGVGSNGTLVDHAGGSSIHGGEVFLTQSVFLGGIADDSLQGSRGQLTITSSPGQVLSFKLVFFHRNALTGDALVASPKAFVGKSATITLPAAGISIGSGSFTIASGVYWVQHLVDPNVAGGETVMGIMRRELGSANTVDILPARCRLGLLVSGTGLTASLADQVAAPSGSDPFTNPADIAVGGTRIDNPQALTAGNIASRALDKLNASPVVHGGICPGQDGVSSLPVLPILVPNGQPGAGQRWNGRVSVANPQGLISSGSRSYLELVAQKVAL